MVAIIQSRKAERRRRKISESQRRLHTNVERQFRRAYQSWLRSVIREILARLEAFGTTEVTAEDLFNPANHSRSFSRKLIPQWNLTVWSGAGFEADWIGSQEAKQSLALMRQELELPDNWDPPPSIDVSPSPEMLSDVKTHLHSRQVGVWGQVTRTTHRTLNRAIRKGLADGDDLDAMTGRVRGVLTNYSDYQGRRVARTETTGGMNFGQQRERDELGIEHKEWVSTLDSRNRGADATSAFDHLAPDGQVVANNQPFTVSGESLMFPGDSSLGASAGNTIQCRCTAVASFEKSTKPPPKPPKRVKPPKPKTPKETPPAPKPVAPQPPEPPADPLAKKPAHLGFSGKANKFSEKVWDAVGADGITDEAHARRVGKIMRNEIEKHPVLAKAKKEAKKTRKRLAKAEAEAERLRKALIDAKTDEEAGKLFVKFDKADREASNLKFRLKEAELEVNQSYPQAAKETLSQARDMGYSINEFRANAKPKFLGGTMKPAEKALSNLPTDWAKSIERWAASGNPVKFDKIERGYFNQFTRNIKISGKNADELASTMLHEMAHAAERNHKISGDARLARLQKEFLERRAKGAKPTKIYKNEIGYEDDFESHYSGRIYGSDDHFEILTTGIESVFDPVTSFAAKGYNYWTDADYMEFILGLLVGI